jgi:hypothetical protein
MAVARFAGFVNSFDIVPGVPLRSTPGFMLSRARRAVLSPKYFYLAQIEYVHSFKLSGNLPVPKLS